MSDKEEIKKENHREEKKKEEIKDNKEQKKEERNRINSFYIIEHELKFLSSVLVWLFSSPFLLIFYSFKGKPFLVFEKLIKIFKEEIDNYHKQAIILVLINAFVFLLYRIMAYFKLDNYWFLIFTSNKENFYLFNLNFMAHYQLLHFLINMLFLYNFAYILSHRFNVIKLFFLFGFILNIFDFLTSFFIKMEPSLGTSGIISAFATLALIYYPFSISILLVSIYFLFFYNYAFSYLLSLKVEFLKDYFNLIKEGPFNNQIFTLAHFWGYLLGIIFAFFHYKELKNVNKTILFILTFLSILVLGILVSKFIFNS
ncbi:MAG: hypothetical protein ABGW69_02645 [Nanoarchaeota archaeon]